MAQVKAVNVNENETLKRLEVTQMKIEDTKDETEEAQRYCFCVKRGNPNEGKGKAFISDGFD